MSESAVQENKGSSFWKKISFQAAKNYHMRLGEVLQLKKLITKEQLDKALDEKSRRFQQSGRSVRLANLICELGYASEENVIAAINDHYALDVVSLTDDIEGLIRKKRHVIFKKLPRPTLPIWVQISIATTLIICLVIFILSFFTLNRQKDRLYAQSVKTGVVSLNYFANNARIPLLEDNVLRLNSLIKEATSVEGLVFAVIVNHKGIIKAHTDHSMIDNAYYAPFHKAEDVTKEGGVSYYNTRIRGTEVINLTQPILFKNKTLGNVHVGVSLDFIQQVILKERRYIILITVISVFLGIVIAMLLGFRFSRPISRLVEATREIAKGNFKHRIELDRKDELGNLAMSFNHMSEELLMKSYMQDSFGKYVGTEILDLIMSDPQSDWLKGHRNEATVIFTDIRGFTAYSDAKEPEEVVSRLNEYFEIATRTILEYGGYVDKFIGDAVLAIFGVPVFHKDHVMRAVRAAYEMQQEFLAAASNNGNPLLKAVGIAINSGIVVSGNIGSQVKMEYTVIGDTVNVASRLNGLAGPGEVIISKNVYAHLEDVLEAEARAPQKIKGKPFPVQTFKLLGIREEKP